jgi:polyvinyl alcohol dehydrogenase (cytochrome)
VTTRTTRLLVTGLCVLLTSIGCERQGPEPDAAETMTASRTADPYDTHCAACHESGEAARAPGRVILAEMSPRALLRTLTTGAMAAQAAALSDEERLAVVQAITGRLPEPALAQSGACAGSARSRITRAPVRWSGWGGDASAQAYRPREQADGDPHLAWTMGFPGAQTARSQPAVLGEQVVVGSQSGEVYALQLSTGCRLWIFEADAALRGAISTVQLPSGQLGVAFADVTTNVYLLDAVTGAQLWQTRVGRHPYSAVTGSVAVADSVLLIPLTSGEALAAADPRYPCCSSSGELVAVRVRDGSERWRFQTVGDTAREVARTHAGTPILAPSGAPIWSSPTVDLRRRRAYIGTGQNYSRPTTTSSDAILAIDLDNGQLVWGFQGLADDAYNLACLNAFGRQVIRGDASNCPEPIGPDVDFGMAPILVDTRAGPRLIAGQKTGVVYALDPDRRGRVVWSTRVGRGGPNGGVHWGVASDGHRVYVPIADTPTGITELDPPGEARPGVYALDAVTGEVLWSHGTPERCADRPGCRRGQSAAPVVIGDRVVVGGLDGFIDILDAASGAVRWSFNTAQSYERTVNGVPARGGAIDGPSAVVAGDFLLVSSGYAFMGQLPGNALLAFRLP